jgi:hypothetical protein
VEEIMRIKQAIIPAILALSAAGSIMIGSAAPAVASTAQSTVSVGTSNPYLYFHDLYFHD